MGRSKIPIEYIQKDKKRSTTYDKRKKGLLKKAYELATLCDVPLCVVIYPGPNSAPVTYPEKEEEVRAVIERYTSGSREVNAKRCINLQQGLELGKKKKGDDQRHGGGGGGGSIDGYSREELVNLASNLDHKLYQVEERIRMATSAQIGGGGGGFDHRMQWAIDTWQPNQRQDHAGCSSSGGGFDHRMQWAIDTWQPNQRQDHVGCSSSGGAFDHRMQWAIDTWQPNQRQDHVGCSSSGGGSSYDPNPNVFMGPNCYFGQVGSSLVKFEPDQYMSSGANPGQLKWYEQGKIFF